MTLESPDKDFFQAATGYAELGMFEDANEQLEHVLPSNRMIPEIIALRVAIYYGLQKWELMREVARRLHEAAPENVQWLISYAYASRRAESITAAKNILIHSLDTFSDKGIIYYNLACYSQLGLLESAKNYLNRAFESDPNLRGFWCSSGSYSYPCISP
jgi:tetratricopeptide (TPR) repeat protein